MLNEAALCVPLPRGKRGKKRQTNSKGTDKKEGRKNKNKKTRATRTKKETTNGRWKQYWYSSTGEVDDNKRQEKQANNK